MATLSTNDRRDIWTQWMQENTDPVGALTKPELRAAVDAMDQWISDNGAAFNTAVPQPARTALSIRQKSWLFSAVVRKRFDVGA